MRHPLVLAAISGLVLALAFPPMPGGLLSLVGYVPLLYVWACHAHDWSRPKLFAITYVTFFLFHGISNWWVASWQEQTDPFLMASGIVLAFGHPVFLALPWFVLASIRTHLGMRAMLWLAPFAVSGFEWIHGQSELSYPWLTSGYMLIDTPLAQAADLVGVYGLSFALLSVNAAIAALVIHGVSTRRRTAAMVAAILGVWFAYGLIRANAVGVAHTDGSATIRVGLVQPNENPWDKWSDPRQQVQRHRQLVDSARMASRRAVDVYVWSETAIPYPMQRPEYAIDWQSFRRWVDTSNVSVLTGYSDLMAYPPGMAPASARTSRVDPSVRYDAFNSAIIISPYAADVPIHRKTNLTPFGERLPFADQFTFAMEWIKWGVGISAWGVGRERRPLPLRLAGRDSAYVGVIICIESIYPETSRDQVRNGADVLCVITNDAWYNGTPGPRQHYDIARMRAIELRRDIVRVGNSGVSGIITADGQSRYEINPMTSTVGIASVNVRHDRTIYAAVGDIIPPLGALLSILLWLATRFPALLRNMRIRTYEQSTDTTP
ncbi:MAG: apolipoprotein N-acyltransferase [Candidatus Kapabacteria bacterium]|nr:apolipoprotein N-acyltransferase [Candidatus Kapabacteria bacterium]